MSSELKARVSVPATPTTTDRTYAEAKRPRRRSARRTRRAATIAAVLAEQAQRLEYRPNERTRYREGGRPVADVTTVLGTCVSKPALVSWAARQTVDFIRERTDEGARVDGNLLEQAQQAHRNPKDPAGETGYVSDEAVRAWLQGERIADRLPADPASRAATLAALGWLAQHRLEVVAVDLQVATPESPATWAGTVGLVAFVDGRLSVIDWASVRKGVFRETPLQLGAYAYAVDATLAASGLRYGVEQTVALRVSADSSLAVPLVRDDDEWRADAAAFLAGFEVYDHLKAVSRSLSRHQRDTAPAPEAAA